MEAGMENCFCGTDCFRHTQLGLKGSAILEEHVVPMIRRECGGDSALINSAPCGMGSS